MLNGKIPFLSDHLSRIKDGMNLLKINVPKNLSEKYFEKNIHRLAIKNKIQKNARIKIIVWRNAKGLYTPENNKAGWMMEIFPMNDSKFILNEKGLIIDVFEDIKKTSNLLSNFKTNNSIPFILASLFAKEKKIDDTLILNQYGRICETTNSNLFIVNKSSNPLILTPHLSEGCIAGVMRKNILAIAKKSGIKIVEKKITRKEIMNANEIFLTNAIDGIKWVRKFNDKYFQNEVGRYLCERLNESI